RDVEFLEQGVELALALAAIRLDHFEHRADVVLDVETAEDRGLLRQIADAEPRALVHRQTRDVVAFELNAATVGLDEPGDHVEHGGLAGAVGAEESYCLAAAHVEARALDYLAAPEGLLDPMHRKIIGLGAARVAPRRPAPRLGQRDRRVDMAPDYRRVHSPQVHAPVLAGYSARARRRAGPFQPRK